MEYLQWAFPVVGVLSILSGLRTMFGTVRFRSRAETATAEVTERRHHGGGDDRRMVPVVRFTLPDGRIVEAEVPAGGNPLSNRVGQSVTVRYEPDDPTRVQLAGVQGWSGYGDRTGVSSIVIGVVFLLLGIPALIVL